MSESPHLITAWGEARTNTGRRLVNDVVDKNSANS